MGKLLKMDIYRMMKSKSTWILLIYMAALVLISMPAIGELDPTVADDLIEVLYSNDYFNNIASFLMTQDALIVLIIFSVIFANGLYKTSFITNITGHIGNRFNIAISSIIVIALFELILFLTLAAATFAGTLMISDTIEFTRVLHFLRFVAIQFFMYLAYAVIIVGLVSFIRNSTICLIITLVYTSIGGVIVWTLVDKLIVNKISSKSSVLDYLLTYNISHTDIERVGSASQYANLWVIMLAWGVFGLSMAYIAIRKRKE